jgi:hypothetical protein
MFPTCTTPIGIERSPIGRDCGEMHCCDVRATVDELALAQIDARPGTLFEAKLTAVGFHETPPARHDRCDRSASRRGSHRERGVAAKLGQGWLVGLVQTVFVMGQHVDDPAFGDAALRACLEHLLYLGLERIQPLDPACDALQVLARQRIHFRA